MLRGTGATQSQLEQIGLKLAFGDAVGLDLSRNDGSHQGHPSNVQGAKRIKDQAQIP